MPRKIRQKATTLLRDRALYVFLAALIAGLFSLTLPPEYFALQSLVFWIVASIGLIAGATTVSTNSKIAWIVGLLAGLAIVLRGIAHQFNLLHFHLAATVAASVLFLFVTYRIGKRVFDSSQVTHEKIAGAVTMYILLGVIWASFYSIVAQLSPEAFRFTSPPASFEQMREELAYYSFVSLTTVGFGDITAVSPFARSLTILEAVIGVLFPNILIARLVSLEIIHSGKSKE